MIIGSWNGNITPGTYEIFIPEKMIPTGVTDPWKEETDKIVPDIIKPVHAAGRIIPLKV